MLFNLRTEVLVVIVFTMLIGATVIGLLIGRSIRSRSDEPQDSFGVMQGALLGFMALVLAFGLSLAIGRYEDRRAATAEEAAILGTTYLRAQTLAEPMRTESLALLRHYADLGVRIANTVPGSGRQRAAVAASDEVEQELWRLAGEALDRAPVDSAPRLYAESLNESFDDRVIRIASLDNRVPPPVIVIELAGASLALALLGVHLGVLGRGALTSLLAALFVGLLLLVTFDLDRPTRGLITVPATTLEDLQKTMELPPAAEPPNGP
jgi:hypothetical protein